MLKANNNQGVENSQNMPNSIGVCIRNNLIGWLYPKTWSFTENGHKNVGILSKKWATTTWTSRAKPDLKSASLKTSMIT